MPLKEITIQSDFFQMLKILPPACRHEVLDALLVYAFGNTRVPMRPVAKAVFDIIQRDIDSQIYPEKYENKDLLSETEELDMSAVLPGDVCRAEMPFPHLWRQMPYETKTVVRPDLILCNGENGTCPYKTTLESVPQLAETAVVVENAAQKKHAPYIRLEVPVLRAVPGANGYPDDTEIVIQTIVMEKGKWRDVMERFIKTNGHQTGAAHPMSRLPFMRAVGPTAITGSKKAMKKNRGMKTDGSIKTESLTDKMTKWTQQLSWTKEVDSEIEKTTTVCSCCYPKNDTTNYTSHTLKPVDSCEENNGPAQSENKPIYHFWPVTEEENDTTQNLNCLENPCHYGQSDKKVSTGQSVVSVARAYYPFSSLSKYARRVSHGTN